MKPNRTLSMALVALGLALTSCGERKGAVAFIRPLPAPTPKLPPIGDGTSLPPPPLIGLAPPQLRISTFQGRHLSEFDADDLVGPARDASAAGRHEEAIALQTWAVKGSDGGRYNLACYSSLGGDLGSALYWLVEAGKLEGVDADWADNDPDFDKLRKDPRWPAVARYLRGCNAYWARSGIVKTVLVVPEGYQVGTPVAVVIGLHGMGSSPGAFVFPGNSQRFADELGMAIVGVSGNTPRGPHSFIWSEDGEAVHKHLQAALKSLESRLTPRPGDISLYGFSQGAEMAFEAAWLHPEAYRGALVISPGTTGLLRVVGTTVKPGNKDQGYVCTCGGEEHSFNVALTRRAANCATKAGSRVLLKLYEGVSAHSFPADFADKFVDWVALIRGPAPAP